MGTRRVCQKKKFKGDVLQLQTDTRDGERRAVRPKIGVRPKRETSAGFKSQLDIRRPLLLTFAEKKDFKAQCAKTHCTDVPKWETGSGCWLLTDDKS